MFEKWLYLKFADTLNTRIQYIPNLVLLAICLRNDSPENANEISKISDQKK